MQYVVDFKSAVTGFFPSKLPTVSLDLNVSFLQQIPAAFKLAHTVLGMICLVVIAHFCQVFHPITGDSLGFLCSNSATFFMLVAYGCFTTSVIIIITSIFSHFTASFLPKTAFEFTYHLISCIMYLSASINLLIDLVTSNTDKGTFREPGFDAKISASVLGLLNGILYAVSTYFSFESHRQMS